MAIALPPWLTPSDPAPAVLRGFSIGAEIGNRQAAQRFQEMQMARQEQMDAMQQARWEAEIGLKAAEAAQKHQAQMAYQNAIESGVDPLDAMIRFGPAMGQQASAEAAAIRAMYQKEKTIPTWTKQDFGGANVLLSREGKVVNLPRPSTPSRQWEPAVENGVHILIDKLTRDRKPDPAYYQGMSPLEQFVLRNNLTNYESELGQKNKELSRITESNMYQNAIRKKEADRRELEQAAVLAFQDKKQELTDLQRQISEMRRFLLEKAQTQPGSQTGVSAPAGMSLLRWGEGALPGPGDEAPSESDYEE